MDLNWVRGALLGKGSFGTVNLAIGTAREDHIPQIMAVKSAALSQASSLKKERQVLAQLQGCPRIPRCFGDDITVESGNKVYNLFLEYVPGGTLADRLKNSGGRLAESDVRRYARSILQGLDYIHGNGYVHCDIKPQNILISSASNGGIKITDFGLAKKVGEEAEEGFCLRGTPFYISPESVVQSEYEPPSDIWSFGCVVGEMIAGEPVWKCRADANVNGLLFRIGFCNELPDIPSDLSEQGGDFLRRCFVRDPAKRWTAEMLLKHPFIEEDQVMGREEAVVANSGEKRSSSPRSAFDFPQWCSLQSSMPSVCSVGSATAASCITSSFNSPADRIQELAMGQEPNWSSWDGDWITVREADSFVFQLEEGKAEVVSTRPLVTPESDSFLKLEEMVMRNENRERNSSSSSWEAEDSSEFNASTSSNVEPVPVFPFPLSSMFPSSNPQCRRDEGGNMVTTSNSTEEFPCQTRARILDQFTCNFNRIMSNGSEIMPSNCYCIDSSVTNEYKHRIFC